MEPNLDGNLDSDADSFSESKISQKFCDNLRITTDSGDGAVKDDENGGSNGDGGDSEEEFTFMSAGEDVSTITAEDAFANGQIKPIFPLFNRDLLFSGGDSAALRESLPARPPVKKLFVEASGDAAAAGPYCEWSSGKAVEATSAEICRKSNSTGFSKLWRFKDFLGRSNSDGRDAYVFLNNNQASPPPPPPSPPAAEKTEKKSGKKEGKREKVKKSKTTSLSPHESYLKSKAKEDRRRSYLPYRPELMGFFTNINGGLTKNVHPY
ncbi:uncharacterized protein LOC127245361 [Andrographis paniculata]|uniref:uncharacterized protein LOC127245361 n=1 Tax=Andrographis paniculata TaxID=175694 RepID=UPI0021E73CB7|nr:uncharacterized protein LOC127245361 [Andrographis paniculata]